jgi:hypothetical protein
MKKLLVVSLLGLAAPIWAQNFETWFSGGEGLMTHAGLGTDEPFGGSPNDVTLTDGFRFAFRAAFNTEGIFGHEVQYSYQRTHLQFNDQSGTPSEGMGIHNGGYNFLVYATKEGARIRPFGTGGVGFFNFVPPGESAISGGGSTKFGFSYGGGVKVHLFKIFGVRADLRQYTSPKPFGLPLASGWLQTTEISAGFGVQY